MTSERRAQLEASGFVRARPGEEPPCRLANRDERRLEAPLQAYRSGRPPRVDTEEIRRERADMERRRVAALVQGAAIAEAERITPQAPLKSDANARQLMKEPAAAAREMRRAGLAAERPVGRPRSTLCRAQGCNQLCAVLKFNVGGPTTRAEFCEKHLLEQARGRPRPREQGKPVEAVAAPRCCRAGCDEPAKHYGERAGYGKMCARHAAEKADGQRIRRKAGIIRPRGSPSIRSAVFSIRLDPEVIERIRQAAEREDKSTRDWCRQRLLAAARHQEPKPVEVSWT